jgi:hypothetical protein
MRYGLIIGAGVERDTDDFAFGVGVDFPTPEAGPPPIARRAADQTPMASAAIAIRFPKWLRLISCPQ